MVDEIERTDKGTFKKGGKSPNGKGRPQGVRNKKMTDAEIINYVGKRRLEGLKMIYDMASDTTDSTASRLKALILLFGEEEKAVKRVAEAFDKGLKGKPAKPPVEAPKVVPIAALNLTQA